MLLEANYKKINKAIVCSEADTFAGNQYQLCEIMGPVSLIRLVSRDAYKKEGSNMFWMEQGVCLRLLREARLDLASAKGTSNYGKMVRLHMRFQARNQFAVSQNWNDLDRYIRLSLPAGKSLYAFVGKVKEQPAISPQKGWIHGSKISDDQAKELYNKAKQAGVPSFTGLGTQIVIDFNLKIDGKYVNHYAKANCIAGPYPT